MSWKAVNVGVLAALAAASVHLPAATILVEPARTQQAVASTAELSELWHEPDAERNLLFGVGGEKLKPSSASTFTILDNKKGGFSKGYTARDAAGRDWSVKLYPEARTEVVASRILWGIGYHQPPIYSLDEWTADGAKSENPQPVARFREEKPAFHGLAESDSWAYDDNPFVGTRQLNGLLVLQVMLANADLKPAQNMLYTLDAPVEGARRWYVARDLGQSFGRSGVVEGLRDDIENYDRTRFITGVRDGRVQFEFYSRQARLLQTVTAQDVRWICQRLSMLSDQQWIDAFRAGGYAESTAQRYIRRMKLKIAEGLALS